MMRIKLFGLFIAFALLALVRPRKCLELLEEADAVVKRRAGEFPPLPGTHYNACGDGSEPLYTPEMMHDYPRVDRAQECPLPPAGWRCTRRAGHDGPCAAVAK
jgi:hypothetical protein